MNNSVYISLVSQECSPVNVASLIKLMEKTLIVSV